MTGASEHVRLATVRLASAAGRHKKKLTPVLPMLRPAQAAVQGGLHRRGRAALARGSLERARDYLTLASCAGARNAVVLLDRARVHSALGDAEEARRDVEVAVSLNGGLVAAWRFLGEQARRAEGSLAEIDTWLRAVDAGAFDPPTARRAAAELLRDSSVDPSTGLRRLRRLAGAYRAVLPEDPYWLGLELRCLLDLGDLEAADSLLTAHDDSSLSDEAGVFAALLDFALGRTGSGWQRVSAIRDGAFEAVHLAQAAAALWETGWLEEARSCDRRAAALVLSGEYEADPALCARAGHTAYRYGDHHAAATWFRLVTDARPDEPWPWLWLARAHRSAGRLDAAEEAAEKAILVAEEFPQAWVELARLAQGRHDGVRCAACWWRVLDLAPGDTGYALEAADSLERVGTHDAALAVIDHWLAMGGDDELGLVTRHRLLQTLGRHSEAQELVDHLKSLETVEATRTLILILLDGRDALSAARELRALPREAWDAKLVQRVARHLKDAGAHTAAYDLLGEASARSGNASLERQHRRIGSQLRELQGAALSPFRAPQRPTPVPGRVLHVVRKSLPDVTAGYTVRTKYIVESQQRAGLEPHVFTTVPFERRDGRGRSTLPREEVVGGVTHHRLHPPTDPPADGLSATRQTLERGAEIINSVRPAVLHAASNWQNAALALELGRRLRLPVVYEVRGLWEETWLSKDRTRTRDRDFYRLTRQRELECMLAADRVVTLGTALKEDLVERGVPEERVVVVPNAIDPSAFPVPPHDGRLAARVGLRRDRVTLGYISSLVEYEGIDVLLRATAHLVERGVPVQTLIVGDGAIRVDLEQHAAALGIGDRCFFPGAVPHGDILAYYGLIDLFVVPRTGDRVCDIVTPLKPYEAMAAGRPLLVADLRALREIVDEGATGTCFVPEKPEDLAARAESLIGDRRRLADMGAAAAEAVRATHTWERNAERYLTLYRELGAA